MLQVCVKHERLWRRSDSCRAELQERSAQICRPQLMLAWPAVVYIWLLYTLYLITRPALIRIFWEASFVPELFRVTVDVEIKELTSVCCFCCLQYAIILPLQWGNIELLIILDKYGCLAPCMQLHVPNKSKQIHNALKLTVSGCLPLQYNKRFHPWSSVSAAFATQSPSWNACLSAYHRTEWIVDLPV